MNLSEAKNLELELAQLPDTRPDWLKALPHASEPTAGYYRFLYHWCQRFQPKISIEIGTYVGTSAAHMAAGNPNGTVITVDCNPDAIRRVNLLGLSNIMGVLGDSMLSKGRVAELLGGGQADLLYIDGLHNFNQAWGEYAAYRDLVREGGWIFFDDVDLQMATREMQILWEAIPETKVRLDSLHHTGWGGVVKDNAVRLPKWDDVAKWSAQKQAEAMSQ